MTKRTKILIGSLTAVAVTVVATVVVVAASQGSGAPSTAATRTPLTVVTPGASVEPSAPVSSPGAVTGGGATAAGWVVEPTTTNAAEYAEAALRAVTTFDTRKATREQFLAYLKTWMTTFVRDTPGKDLDPDRTARIFEQLGSDVVPPSDLWDEMTAMQTTAEPSFPEGTLEAGPSGFDNQSFASVVEVTYRPHGSTEEPWADSRKLAVVVRCDEYTIPRPGSDQKPGDCKVINWAKLDWSKQD